jgi:hypothetical protein
VLQKDRVEHARTRALAQMMLDKEKGIEAFEDYKRTNFPWLEKQKKRDKDDHVEKMMREIRAGGLSIQPIGDQRVKSRLRAKQVYKKPDAERVDSFYSKLGKSIPI